METTEIPEDGDFDNNGDYSGTSTEIEGAGTFDNEGDGTVEVPEDGSVGVAGTYSDEGTMSDSDAITIGVGGNLAVTGTLTEGAGGQLTNFGTLTIATTGTLNVIGSVTIEPGATYSPLGTVLGSVAVAAPTVFNPAGPDDVGTDTFTITGAAQANSTVSLYSDPNQTGSLTGTGAALVSSQTAGTEGSYSFDVNLTANATNYFFVTATFEGTQSAPTAVPAITQTPRAVWVYTDQITTPTARQTLVNQSAASGISTIYISVYQSTVNSAGRYMYDDGEIAALITLAHAQGIQVWADYGAPDWPSLGTDPGSFPMQRFAEVVAYNTANPTAPFDGVMFDVEYVYDPTNPATNDAQENTFLTELLPLYQADQGLLNPAGIQLGAAISPFWNPNTLNDPADQAAVTITFSPQGTPVTEPAYQQIIDLGLNQVVVLGYRDFAGSSSEGDGIIGLDQDEVNYAVSTGISTLIVAGLETQNITPSDQTFYGVGNADMNSVAQTVAGYFGSNLAGFAIDAYGDAYLSGQTNWPDSSPATPGVSVNPVDITYGTPLADAQLISGTATVKGQTVQGTFTFTPAEEGLVLPAGNGQSEQVIFTPTDNTDYVSVTANVTLNVGQAPAPIIRTFEGLGILVPAYFYPTPSGGWDQMAAAAGQVSLTAILNPNSGPGSAFDPNYAAAVDKLRAAGGAVIGYVDTAYGTRSIAAVEADISTYNAWYHLDGIFLDDMTNDAGAQDLSYYQQIYNYIHTLRPDWTVVGNPGSNTAEGYATNPDADNLVLFENGVGYDTYTPPSWQASLPAQDFTNLVYNVLTVSAMQADVSLAASRNTGWIYVTDGNLPNPWSTLPSYWTSLVSAVAAANGTITFGTNNMLISGQVVPNPSTAAIPAGETVQVTLNGVTQNTKLDTGDRFSTSFATAALGVAGSPYPISFRYAGDANVNGATASGTLTVTPASQTIEMPIFDPAPYGPPISLFAGGGGSGNPVTFSVVSGPGIVNGDMLTFIGIGNIVIEADQAGNANYAAAPPLQRSILVTANYQVPASENENGTPTPVTLLSLLGGHYNDVDGSANFKPGVAVFQTSGNGTWQYSANGTTWTAIGNVSQLQALLLPEGDSVRFMPATNWSGQANLYFVAWDGSQGKAGGSANVIAKGGTTPFSVGAGGVAVTVKPMPIWVGTGAALTPVLRDSSQAPAGDTIAAVFGNYFQDNNPAVSVGVAIVSVTGASTGAWQFLPSGGAWTNFPTVSATAALLLSANDMIRYVPKSTFVGAATLKALAWDGSVGDPVTLGSSAFSTTTLTATASVNRAPTLANAAINASASVAQYATGSAITVSSLLTPSQAGYADPDGKGLPQGIAIIGAAANGGTAQYMLTGGSWQTLPSVAPSAALLLPSNASLRLIAGSLTGATTLTFDGWDQTQGFAGQTFDATGAGSATAFSANPTTLSITVTPSTNHAPTLSLQPLAPEPAVAVNTIGSAITVSTLLKQAGDVDPDGATLAQGIAIVGATAAGGTEEYMLPGKSWQPLPSASTSSALLLPSSASVRLEAGSAIGTAMLTFDGWDQTQGSAGQLFDIANVGGASAFSATSVMASVPIGAAPSWSAATGAALTDLPPGVYSTTSNSSPPVNSIATVFGSFFLDGSLGRPVGIAVSAVAGNGTWQYSLTSGAAWATFAPTLSKSSAFLLSASDLIRFVPRTTGPQIGTLTTYAWDGTVYSPGTVVNLSQLGIGGATPFSATTLIASSAFNTAPTLTPPTPPTSFNPVFENVNSAAVTAASLLSKAGFADLDGKSVVSGIAITADTGPGVWQWLKGATWTALPSLPANSAFLLPSATQLRFQPANNLATNTNGSATLTYLAWDETAGSADTVFPLTSQGGATAFSLASATASMPVNFVKQAPIWLSGTSAAFTPVLGFSPPPTTNPTPSPVGDTVAAVFGSAFHDAAGAPVGVAIIAQTGTSDGTWQYLINGTSTWQTFPTLSASAALLLSANDLIRFVPSKSFSGTVSLTAYAWDGTGNSTNNIANLNRSGIGGSTPFSATTLVADCLVNSAPTPGLPMCQLHS